MNHHYTTVFNRSLGIWQVTSELTKLQGKSGKATVQAALCTAGCALALVSGQAHAQYVIDGGATETVPGDHSSPWNIGGDLYVGNASTGMLTIENGGKVSNTWGYVGVDSGSTGTVTVTGSGSTWTNSYELYVGFAGNGTLTIENGGTVSNTVGNVGRDAGSTGTVTVTGAGSTWTNSGSLYVGRAGTGTLRIENGGTVTNGIGYIGASSPGGAGTVTVTGAGSSWINSDNLYIGLSGTGTLTIEDGGTVRVANTELNLNGNGNGTLNLNGTAGNRGVLETGYVRRSVGTTAFNFDGGILRARGTQSNFLRNFTANSISINAGGAFFDTQSFDVGIINADILTGSGGLTKLGTGKLSIAGTNGYGGNTTVSAGTLEFDTYNQNASQILGIGASSDTDYGKLNVIGTATFELNANIEVNVTGANTLASDQTLAGVVTAGTLNASTFSVTDNSTLFNFRAILNGNAIDLITMSASATNSGVYDAVMANRTYSASGAARMLDDMIATAVGGDMGDVITALGSLGSEQEVSRAAAQTLPLLSGGISQSTMGMLSSFNGVVQQRLGNPVSSTSGSSTTYSSGSSGDSSWNNRQLWVKPFGSHADQDDHNGAAGFASRTFGIAFGAEGELNANHRLGVAYAYADSRIKGNTALSGTRQRADMESHLLAVYGSLPVRNNLQLDWQADVGRNGIEGARYINFGSMDRTATSNYTSYSAHAGAALSKALAVNDATSLMPGLRIDYTWLRDPAYRESGADALNLDVERDTTQALVLTAEGRLRHRLSERSWLNANVGVGYDALNERTSINSTYAGAPGQSFTTTGSDRSPWTVKGGIGYTLQTGYDTQISLRYDVEGRKSYVNQSASLRASWAF